MSEVLHPGEAMPIMKEEVYLNLVFIVRRVKNHPPDRGVRFIGHMIVEDIGHAIIYDSSQQLSYATSIKR